MASQMFIGFILYALAVNVKFSKALKFFSLLWIKHFLIAILNIYLFIEISLGA